MFRGFREILSVGEIGVGIGFEDVDPSIFRQSKVERRILPGERGIKYGDFLRTD